MDTCFSHPSLRRIPDAALLADLTLVAGLLRTRRLSITQYQTQGRFSAVTICRRFGSWTRALARVKCQPWHLMNVSPADLIRDMQRVARKRKTKILTFKTYQTYGKHCFKQVHKHFGRWSFAANAAGLQAGPSYGPGRKPARDPREINLKLRYDVLRRDHFRCVACGQSPATNPMCELEIDHIIPWSKGGPTRLSNLRTLCHGCNRGKSAGPR